MTTSGAALQGTALDCGLSALPVWPAVTGRVRKLGRDEPALVCGHLLRLSHGDRRMRFCGRVSDDFIRRYANAPHAHAPLRMGYFEDGRLRGCAELFMMSRTWLARRAELALSVEGPWQGRGIGSRLADETMLLARNRAVDSVHMQWLVDNAPMHALARALRARVTVVHGEARGVVFQSLPSHYTLAREMITDGCAAISHLLDTAARSGTSHP